MLKKLDLGPSWAPFGRVWGRFWEGFEALGASWAVFWPHFFMLVFGVVSTSTPGGFLAGSWIDFGGGWRDFERVLGGIWEGFGRILGYFWLFWAILGYQDVCGRFLEGFGLLSLALACFLWLALACLGLLWLALTCFGLL